VKTVTKRPPFRRDFLGNGDELNYLSDVLTYLGSIDETGTEEAIRLLGRFADLLNQRGLDDGSIMLQDHWALLHELRGNVAQAIVHRQREIALIERSFTLGGPVGDVNHAFLRAKMEMLAHDYCRHGEQEMADQIAQQLQKWV
jgi:hypothetical protein